MYPILPYYPFTKKEKIIVCIIVFIMLGVLFLLFKYQPDIPSKEEVNYEEQLQVAQEKLLIEQENTHELFEQRHSTPPGKFENTVIPTECSPDEDIVDLVIPINNMLDGPNEMVLQIHKDYTEVIAIVFRNIYESGFPINPTQTKGFTCRRMFSGNYMSYHAIGEAIDINANINPMFDEEGNMISGRVYDTNINGTITKDSVVVKEFEKIGWTWMGEEYYDRKDYMHFSKSGR